MIRSVALLLMIGFALQSNSPIGVANSSPERLSSGPSLVRQSLSNHVRKHRNRSRGRVRCRRGPQAPVNPTTAGSSTDIQPATQEDGPGKYRPASTPTPSMEPVFPKVRKKP